MTGLKLAPGLTLPYDIVTEAIGIVANRGAGKTFTSKAMVELMTEAGLPTAVIDPLGVFWGLRSSTDGTKPGLPFTILGGSHADLPLLPTSGKVIAQWLLENPVPVILDLSGMRKAEQRRFVYAFMEELYEGNKDPLHVVVDECDLFVPQRPSKDFPPNLLGIMEDVVRRGRAKGLGITLISQRPAVIHKDVLSQISVLICLRLFGPQDRKAIADWIDTQGTAEERKEIIDSLPSLRTGEGWFYSPAFMGILQKFRANPVKTFDSSATPKMGERRIEPTAFASVDLDSLSVRMADTIEKAEANDPKHLKAEVARLQRRVADLDIECEIRASREVEPVEVIREVVPPEILDALEGAHNLIVGGMSPVNQGIDALDAALVKAREVTKAKPAPPASPSVPKPPLDLSRPRGIASTPKKQERAVDGPSKVETEILTVLAQYPDGRSMSQIALLTGRSSKSGGFKNGLSSLRSAGYLIGPNTATMQVTTEGLGRLGPFDPLPDGRELFEHWISNLGKAEKACLNVLVGDWPNEYSLEDLAPLAGYSEKSGGYKNALSKLRTLGLVEGPNASMKASDMLFENGDWR